MTKGDIVLTYRSMSAEDRRHFDRWLKANAIVGSILAVGLVAMALAGADVLGPSAAVAKQRSLHSVSAQGRVPSAFELMSTLAPEQLPILQVHEPF